MTLQEYNIALEEKAEREKADTVNHPQHYTSGDIECIDAMESAYGLDAVMNFCKCNAFKYIWRFDKKNNDEDIEKSKWYLNKYRELEAKKRKVTG